MKLKRIFWPLFLFFLVLFLLWAFKWGRHYPWNQKQEYRTGYFGVTYSIKMAEELGIDWQEAYLAALDELGVRNIRLPLYWDQIEPHQNEFDFSKYDWILDEGAKRNAEFVINVGYRLPRWPECHAPGWAVGKDELEREAETLEMITAVVDRYKDRGEVEYWQVENEPFLNVFGVCPESDLEFLQQEIDLVNRLDSRPILVSASGELSTWRREAKVGDVFGTTLYRVVWGPWTGYIRYPLPAAFYRLKADLADIPQAKRVISELQAEPWVPAGSLKDLSDAEAKKSFDIKQFKANAQFAINVDFQKAYLWGVEWWYQKKVAGQSQYWDFAKTLFR